jgi:hypothetical protein
MTRKLQPYHEVTQLIDEVLKSKKGIDCRVLEHLLSFAEHQLGKEVTGKNNRERDFGERISNWKVDIFCLYKTIQTLADHYMIDCHLALLFKMTCAFLT